MRVLQLRVLLHIVTLVFLASGLISVTAHAQDSAVTYELSISDILYQNIKKNWLYLPKSVDLRVDWTATIKDERGGMRDLDDQNVSYRVMAFERDILVVKVPHPATIVKE